MKRTSYAVTLVGSWFAAAAAWAHTSSPVEIEIVGPDGHTFREFPLAARDGTLRSYLQAEKGARYQLRVRNTSGVRLGLVIAVDGRNIIDGRNSELARTEPMYVVDAWDTQEYAGWRANLQAINEFYFTDWSDSYAEAFGDRSARGVIAVAVYREVTRRVNESRRSDNAPPAARAAGESVGTGYGERRVDHAIQVEFTVQSTVESRHFIKYEWRETLCRKQVLTCGEQNRLWDESTLGFAPPPPGRTRRDQQTSNQGASR